jgi:isochorismate hydrolase
MRLAVDLDYHLIVVEDGCADRDPEVHQLLMAKVSPRQGTVVRAEDMVTAPAALSGVFVRGGHTINAPWTC